MNKTGHQLYHTWRMMKQRCGNPNKDNYEDYGGRGIRVCDRWDDETTGFWSFIEDMGPRPEGHTLDRIDIDGDYEPRNCRWATKSEQECNKRNTRFLTCEVTGVRKSISLWARDLGTRENTIRRRIEYMRWPVQKAITTPVAAYNRRLPSATPA